MAESSNLEAANLKLHAASAIVDLVAMLDEHEGVDSLKAKSLEAAMLHVGERIDEARDLMNKTEARP